MIKDKKQNLLFFKYCAGDIFNHTSITRKKNTSLLNDLHVTGMRQNQVVIVTVNICLLRVMKRLMSFCSAVVENEMQCVFLLLSIYLEC